MNRIVLQHLLITLVGSLVLIAAFGLAGTQPRPLWFVAMALAIGFGSVAIRLIFPLVLETTWPARYDEKLAAQRNRTYDNRTQFMATWVQEADRERRAGEGSLTFVRRIRPILLEPDRARALTGDHLWNLITGTEARTASLAEIEKAVQTIEKL